MNKILTVSIAAYNCEKDIEHTLNSVLVNNIDDLEVLVEDDGGTDSTADIVKEYEKKYPGIVKLVHKENGGYGSTVNKSIELAQGKYFKQLDGDDWYNSENFEKLLDLLRNNDFDIMYTPYVEYRELSDTYKSEDLFDESIEGLYEYEEIINKAKDCLTMHKILYKTEVLRKSNIKLFEKCLYTDTQFALFPTLNVKTIYITHLPIYVYRIGRAEQSISIPSHRKHYKEHERVTKSLIEFYNSIDKSTIGENKRKYIFNYAKIQTGLLIVKFYLILPPNKENLNQLKEFDKYLLEANKEIYDAVGSHSKLTNILRKTKFNYLVYKILAIFKTNKTKKEF